MTPANSTMLKFAKENCIYLWKIYNSLVPKSQQKKLFKENFTFCFWPSFDNFFCHPFRCFKVILHTWTLPKPRFSHTRGTSFPRTKLTLPKNRDILFKISFTLCRSSDTTLHPLHFFGQNSKKQSKIQENRRSFWKHILSKKPLSHMVRGQAYKKVTYGH